MPYDWYHLVAMGRIPNHSVVVVRGHNSSQSSASGFVDISEFGDLTHLAAEETMNVVSTSTSDNGSGGSTGALTVLLMGVSNTFAPVTELVTLNGDSNVLTTAKFLRINLMIVQTAGSVGSNIGDITATASSAATVQSKVGATDGLSHAGHYTVPLNMQLLVNRLEFNVHKQAGGQDPLAEFRVEVRKSGAAWLNVFDKTIDAGVSNELTVVVTPPSAKDFAPGGTDFRMRADVSENSTDTKVRMYGILMPQG